MQILTGKLDSDANMADALVIHFLDGLASGSRILILDESIATLVGELCNGAELLELVANLVRVNVVAQPADVDLRRRSHSSH